MIEEQVTIGDATLWTARQGTGPALVLCHGGPGLWDYLGPLADMIDDRATVYRYDQRACGRSSGGPPFDVATAIADLEALRAHWGVDSWVVGGHSWGVTLALLYCLAQPAQARGLIYVAGTGIDPAWHADYRANHAARLGPAGQARLAALKERREQATGVEWAALDREYCTLVWSTDFGNKARGRELAGELFVDDLHPNYAVNQLLNSDAKRRVEGASIATRVRELHIPALVIHGDADPRPAWSARHLAAHLPDAQLHILPGVGHLPWLEQPEGFAMLVRAFLRDHLAPPL